MRFCLKDHQKMLPCATWLHGPTFDFDLISNYGMMTGPPSVTPILD
jgi:hypothetical protein